MKYRITGIDPNWNGVITLAIVATLAGIFAMLGDTTVSQLLVAAIVGQLLPSPHTVRTEPEPIVVQDEHGVKGDS